MHRSKIAIRACLGLALLLPLTQTAFSHGSGPYTFGRPAEASEVDRDIAITMKDLSFEPAAVTVQRGEAIRFVVTNTTALDHDFTIGDAATQADHRREMAEMAAMGHDMDHGGDANAVTVKAGQTATLIWKFSRPGTLEFDCNVPGHFEGGMKGTITVVPKQ